METVLLIAGVIILTLIFSRRAPQPQVIYVPIEVANERTGSGCLPLIMAGFLILLALGMIGF